MDNQRQMILTYPRGYEPKSDTPSNPEPENLEPSADSRELEYCKELNKKLNDQLAELANEKLESQRAYYPGPLPDTSSSGRPYDPYTYIHPTQSPGQFVQRTRINLNFVILTTILAGTFLMVISLFVPYRPDAPKEVLPFATALTGFAGGLIAAVFGLRNTS